MANRGELQVQGGGRPFSLVPTNRPAILKHKDVADVLEVVRLDPDQELGLAKVLKQILGEYLGAVIVDDRLANHAQSLKLLSAIARASVSLADQLSRLDQRYLLAIEEERAEPFDGEPPPPFDILMLVHKLNRLSHAATRAGATMKANNVGAPAKRRLDGTVAKLLRAIERQGHAVLLSESGSRAQRRRLDGRGGELLLALFKKFDPHVDEPQLWGSVRRVRTASG